MIKKLFVLSLAVLSLSSFACELPKGKTLEIGCSYNCDFFYRFRLTMTAWGMGYGTRFINLNESADLKNALAQVDGVLIPGGADIDPKYYLDSVSPALQDYTKKNLKLVNFTKEGALRDPFEYGLVKLYSEEEKFKDLPLLGVCRGLQMMSVAQGIPLYLDIKTELGIENRIKRFDRIYLERTSTLMTSLYPMNHLKGFKLHHQGIRVPYFNENADKFPKTKITAYSNDRHIAEAIEYTHRPALGVQYHPERSFFEASTPVFRWFLDKACNYKASSMREHL